MDQDNFYSHIFNSSFTVILTFDVIEKILGSILYPISENLLAPVSERGTSGSKTRNSAH
jgi:hypothetical protein